MPDKTPIVPADPEGIANAAAIIAAGGLVAVPTETVYGLAARADSEEAVAAIFRAKGRPSHNPLIVHVSGLEHARRYAEFDDIAAALAKQHWPGPLTLVLPIRAGAPLARAVGAGLPTIALRAPRHRVMQAILAVGDFALAAPSANRSGFISPTCAEHVAASLDGRIDLVLDDGPCAAGVESTIVALREGGLWEVLRPGPLDLGTVVSPSGGIEAPGQLERHYAPGKPMRLNVVDPSPEEFVIGFGNVAGDCNLSKTCDLTEAASQLYACLHKATLSTKPRIAVAPVPDQGIGVAINDRLRRAAA